MTYLQDENVIFSLALPNHVHHQPVLNWFKTSRHFATCGVAEGTLLKISPIRKFPLTQLTGYKQITDAWLAEQARRKGGKLATLDEGLAVLWAESTQLIPF